MSTRAAAGMTRGGRLSLASAIAEIRKVRAEKAALADQLAELHGLIVALVDAIDHDSELQVRCLWYREGWRAAETAHAGDYDRGFVDGILARKHMSVQIYELVKLERLRWGPGGREHFGDPRPGDHPGRKAS